MRSTRFTVLLLLLGTLSLTSAALASDRGGETRPLPPPSPVGHTPPGYAPPPAGGDASTILYDQLNNEGVEGTNSQNYSPATWDPYDDQLADDFVVPTATTWTIDSVRVDGFYINPVPGSQKGPASSVDVFVYQDSSGLPGTQVFVQMGIIPGGGLTRGNFVIALSPPVVLSSGTYWVSVRAEENYETNGEWKWLDRIVQSNSGAAWENPNGGFGIGCTTWQTRGSQCNLDRSEPDQAFRLIGTAQQSTTTTLTGFTPGRGKVGTAVTITGSGFTGATSVTFGAASASFTVDSDTQISATVPAGATSDLITVTSPTGAASSNKIFKVVPVILDFAPLSGPVGTVVTINGGSLTQTQEVDFNGTAATFTVVSDSQISATVPSGATSGPILVVTVGGRAANAGSFTVTPAISRFSPGKGPVGTAVRIQGTSFTATQTVAFNGTNATFTVDSDTQITATVPTGATSGLITVTTNTGTATSATNFKVTP